MSQSAVTLYSFCFSHHGRFSSFHRLLHYVQSCRVVDATLPQTGWLNPVWQRRLDYRWLRLNEWRLRPIFAKPQRQCVHYLYPENSLFHGAEWKGKHGLVISCHQPPASLQDMKKGGFVGFLQGLAKANRVVLLSENFAAGYAAYCEKSAMRVIPHGVDVHFFRPQLQQGRPPLVLTIGNWLRDYDFWASVVLRISAEMPEVHFVVVALPEIVREAQARVAGRLGHRVRFLHGLSDEALRGLYQEASVLFLPLKDAGANNALLEAMASGVPVLVSDLPATREYAGESGVFFTPGIIDECVLKLGDLLSNITWRTSLGTDNRRRAVELFSWEVIAARYARLYAEVLQA